MEHRTSNIELTLPSPIQQLEGRLFADRGISVWIKREDLIHPELGGNKWRKLKYNLMEARRLGLEKLLTFGGAYSNHIYAVAAAGKHLNFHTIGIVRGERVEPLNPTLAFGRSCGMELHFISRSEYRNKARPDFLESLRKRFGRDVYLIPEGGTNAFAIKGCAEIPGEVESQAPGMQFDYWCLACGTGGTAAGLITGLEKGKVLGFPVLKGDFLKKEIAKWLIEEKDWELIGDYHFGGYAKFNAELIDFINNFYNSHRIPLDPIYTGKMMYGVMDLIEKGYFPKGSNILVLHTGGLQGIPGFNLRNSLKIENF